MKRTPSLLIGVTLAACQPIAGSSAQQGQPQPPPSEAQGASLPAGEYRLAGADGAAVGLDHAITISVSEEAIRMVSGCVRQSWPRDRSEYAYTAQVPAEPSCRRALYPVEQAASVVFSDMQRVARTPENGWLVEGSGRSVTLFSQ